MIEDELRSMLRRRADAVVVEPKPLAELGDRLPVDELRHTGSSRRLFPAAAAVVLAFGLTALALVTVLTDSPERPVDQLPTPVAPFDPETAAPVWTGEGIGLDGTPTEYRDPASAARGYLTFRQVLQPQVDPPVVTPTGTARVRWRTEATSGTVYLRRVDGDYWLVVGAVDDELAFTDVSLRDGRLRFSVERAPGRMQIDGLAIAVFADGRAVPTGGDTVSEGDLAKPDAGQLFHFDARFGKRPDVDVAVTTRNGAPTVRVRQVGGAYLSIAEFVVQPDDGPTGGRLIASGKVGARHWSIYGADHAAETDESPCFLWVIGPPAAEDTGGSQRCGFDGTSGVPFDHLGPAARDGGQTLYLGVLGQTVARVGILAGQEADLVPVTDPIHPAGARVFTAVIPHRGDETIITLRAGDGRVLHRQAFPVAG